MYGNMSSEDAPQGSDPGWAETYERLLDSTVQATTPQDLDGAAATEDGVTYSAALAALRLRAHTTHSIQTRIRAALGPRPDPGAAQRLEALYIGALLSAGLGYSDRHYGMGSAEQVVQRILNRG